MTASPEAASSTASGPEPMAGEASKAARTATAAQADQAVAAAAAKKAPQTVNADRTAGETTTSGHKDAAAAEGQG